MYIYIHMCIYIYICMNIRLYIYSCMYVYMYIYIFKYTNTRINKYIYDKDVFIYTYKQLQSSAKLNAKKASTNNRISFKY
jgi:hypothetical protein